MITPGPWIASPHGDGWHIVAHTPQKDGSTLYTRVATVHAMKGDDAKLIASAPEALDRLRKLAEHAMECFIEADDKHAQQWRWQIQTLQTTIAKMEGKP
jgi:hypothetical protein